MYQTPIKMNSETVIATTTVPSTFAEMYETIFNHTFNVCPTEYSSFQINRYFEINRLAALMATKFIGRDLVIGDTDDNTISEFLVRTMVIMLMNKEISITPINVILSNFGGSHKAIIVNTVEFKSGFKLVQGGKKKYFEYMTLLGPVLFDVGFFENRKMNSQIIFRHELAIKFAKNNIMLKGVLLAHLTADELPIRLSEARDYLQSMEEVLVDDLENNYKDTEKLVSAKIQTQYMMLEIIASIIIVEKKMI
jgi:hypothetical protein